MTLQEAQQFFLQRKRELKDARVQSNIEIKWKQSDADYLPHQLGQTKKVLVENERTEVGTFVNLEKDNWRSRESKNEPFIKIQTALAILFDRNPQAVFSPVAKRYESNTKLIETLYNRSWNDVNIGSRKELKKFIFNLAKYGWSVGRRYYKRVERKDLQAIKRYNLETQEFEYEKKDFVDIDDVYFECKNIYDVWIDDMAKPDDPRTRRDWMWKEIYDEDTFLNVFGKYENAKKVNFSSLQLEQKKNLTSQNLVEVYFYENRVKDLWLAEVNNVLLFVKPLLRDDKELSLVDTYWLLRDIENPYGIGLNEIMRGNKVALDKVRNMTIDQVVLSIYKMFFYSNAEQIDDEGGEVIKIEPGKGKKVIDPKNITWFDVPGPGRDAYELLSILVKDIEDDTGITKTLEGEITGKTAFEISQTQLAALKRLSTPLNNIKSALEWDAKLCVNTMKMIYSVPKVFSFVEPELITDYIASIEDDKDRYFVDEKGVFNALKYREFQLNIEQDKDGIFQDSEDKQFFAVKPKFLDWDGEIMIRVESLVEKSKPLERQNKLEMSNILLPLIGQMASNPMLMDAYIKPVKQLLKIYDEDPKDWLSDVWLQGGQAMQLPMMFGLPGQTMQGQMGLQPEQAETVAPSTTIQPATNESGLIQQANRQTL